MGTCRFFCCDCSKWEVDFRCINRHASWKSSLTTARWDAFQKLVAVILDEQPGLTKAVSPGLLHCENGTEYSTVGMANDEAVHLAVL